MTFLWFVAWLIEGCPDMGHLGPWVVALLVCVLIDLLGGRSRS